MSSRPLTVPARVTPRTLRIPVLLYHRVAPLATAKTVESRDLTVSPAGFAEQLAWLRHEGYHPIHASALLRALYDGAALPSRPVLLTFDDGYADAVKRIVPLLRRHRWPATFFVISGRMGVRGFLDRRQVAFLDRAGMDVGSHSVTHSRLTLLGAAARWSELVSSRTQLGAVVGHPIAWFAYPFGDYDTSLETTARDAGYLLAFTTGPDAPLSTATPFAEPRVEIHGGDSLAAFAQQVRTAS